jgi:hypothetical protein
MVSRFRNSSQSGLGLLEVVLAAGLGTIVIAALMLSMQKMARFNKKVESSTDLSAVRSRLAEAVNCTATFQAASLPLGNPCPAGGYIDLRASGGQMVVPSGGLKVGQWTVRAYCKSSDGSLDIRAAKLRPGAPAGADNWRTGTVDPANFLRDEMDSNTANASATYSWNHPKSRLFATGSAGLCSNWFSGTPGGQCSGPGEYVKSIDFNNNKAICGTVPTCGGGNALRFDGSMFSCDGNYEQRGKDWGTWAVTQAVTQVQDSLKPDGPVTDYIRVVVSSDQSGSRCDGKHHQATASCPSGWLAVSCGYNLSDWQQIDAYASNAPDSSSAINTTSCGVIAGGRPSPNGCFRSVATCLNLAKFANGK